MIHHLGPATVPVWKKKNIYIYIYISIKSEAMNCSMQGFPVLYYLPEFAQTHVHWIGDAIRPSYHLLLPSLPSCPQSFPASGSFPMSQVFASGGQILGASASVLPINIQGRFPLGLNGLILQSKGHSRVFASTTVRKYQVNIM